jgi:hypothetical protein
MTTKPQPLAGQRVEALLAPAGICPVAAIGEDPRLRRAWLEGLSLVSESALDEAERIVRKLEAGRGLFPKNAHLRFEESTLP